MRWTQKWGSPKSSSDEKGHNWEPSVWGKVLDTAAELVDIAELAVLIRGKFRPLDYASLTMRCIKSGMSIYDTWTEEPRIDLTSGFVTDDAWRFTSPFIAKMAFAGLDIPEQMIEGKAKVHKNKVVEAAWTATVEGCEIGWVGPPNETSVPDSIWSKNPRLVSELASRRLWENAGDDKIIRLLGGDNPVPHELPKDMIETSFLLEIQRRVKRFLESTVPRAILLDGEPGTGKSSLSGYIAKQLGYRTIVIEASDFVGSSGNHVNDENGSLSAAGLTLAQLMKPEVLIVNDIDRLDEQDQVKLLDLFDHAKDYAKIVFATTNNYRRLIEPVRRPGRLDDIIHVPGLSLEEIAKAAPNCVDVASRMQGWPIAYVKDMQKRVDVLGLAGKDEIDEVAKRLGEVRADERKVAGAQDAASDELPDLVERAVTINGETYRTFTVNHKGKVSGSDEALRAAKGAQTVKQFQERRKQRQVAKGDATDVLPNKDKNRAKPRSSPGSQKPSPRSTKPHKPRSM